MSLIFCTANITPEFWADFVRRSNSEYVILIRNPDFSPAFRETETQIEEFRTGFEGWSVTKLREFFREYVRAGVEDHEKAREEQIARHGEALAGVDTEQFAVIDEETVREGKSIAMHWYGMPDLNPEEQRQWSEWRVALDGAQNVFFCMIVKAEVLLWEKGADGDGLLRCG